MTAKEAVSARIKELCKAHGMTVKEVLNKGAAIVSSPRKYVTERV